jgi:hypothetical protein
MIQVDAINEPEAYNAISITIDGFSKDLTIAQADELIDKLQNARIEAYLIKQQTVESSPRYSYLAGRMLTP